MCLDLRFLLSPLQPHHYRKAAFEIIGVRVMSVWSDRPKMVVDIREIIGTGRRRGVCGGVHGVCGAAVAKGQILLKRIRRIGVFFRRIQSFQGWHMGNQSPHCRFLLYFQGVLAFAIKPFRENVQRAGLSSISSGSGHGASSGDSRTRLRISAALADAVEGTRPKGRLSSPAVW